MIRASPRRAQRRQRRYPVQWTLVEVDAGGSGHVVPGRLVDTSSGGLGLVLDHAPPVGRRVRVTRVVQSADPAAPSGRGAAPTWEQRDARVAHVTALADGTYRAGLAFRPEPPSWVQRLATHAVLLGVLAVIAVPALTVGGALTPAVLAIGAVLVALGLAVEGQYHASVRAFHDARARWEAMDGSAA